MAPILGGCLADSLEEWASSLIQLIPAGPHQGPLHQKATLSPSQGRCNLETWSTRPLLAIPEMVSPIRSAKVNFLIRKFYGKASTQPQRWNVWGSQHLPSELLHLASMRKGWNVYSCKTWQIFQNELSSPKATTTSGLTTVALPIVDVTLYQILHPQLGTNAGLCDGVTVAMTRALQKAAYREASGQKSPWRKGSLASACCGFSHFRPQTDASCWIKSLLQYGEGFQG